MADYVKYLGIFIGVVMLFSIIAAIYPTASDAGDGLTDEGMCENNACFYNSSRTTECTVSNETSFDTTLCTSAGYAEGGLPLGSLFAGGGVVFIVIAAGLLFYALKKKA